MTFTIKPLEGLQCGEQCIPLGCSKEAVEAVLGQPDIVRDSFYYFCSELRFDFDKNGNAEFIEFSGGIDGQIQPQIYGISAFTAEADELYEILKTHNYGEIKDTENGYSYDFCNISIGVYRESIPEDIEEMIEEMKSDGIDTENNEDLEFEKRKARHWATIGFGRKGYY